MVIKKRVCTRGMSTKTLHIYLTVTLHMNFFMRSLADGVENAVVICCFVTPYYGESENCKLEVEYAQKRGKPLIPCNLGNASTWKPTDWLRSITTGNIWVDFHDVSESNIGLKIRELVGRIHEQCSSTPYLTSQSVDDATYLFELMKHEYRRNSRIQRFINPTRSFPIDDSYINLAIVETKQQRVKEKELSNAKNNDKMMDTFEEIYSTKSPINVKDLFENCKDQLRQVLVFGRAGIGKTTFCRYVTHEWAQSKLWPEYDLVVLFPLRLLTETRYPPVSSLSYSLIDAVEKEYFSHGLCEKEKEILTNELSRLKVLWLLDGYDEIVQNVPSHLQCLFQQMLKTPHHIITSRPYSNTLPYKVQMEITGFTNDNIPTYVTKFFDQIQTELNDAFNQGRKCLEFLKVNPRIWGIAHIPMSLELICSLWSDTDWSENTNITITALYDNMAMWLCRRYLEKQNITFQITKKQLYNYCNAELTFLETLAFEAMVKNTVLIRKELLQKFIEEMECSSQAFQQILNIGILKSYDSGVTGSRFESDKHHYFVHLSFQEYFAARYFCKALKDPADQRVVRLIQNQKYDRHFTLMLAFASGLLTNADDDATLNRFWDLVHNECQDLIGFRHLHLLIPCIDEGRCSDSIKTKNEIVRYITDWLQYILTLKHCALQEKLKDLLRTCTSLVEQSAIQNVFLHQLHTEDQTIVENVLLLISTMPPPDSSAKLFPLVCRHLNAKNSAVRKAAVMTLARLSEKVSTSEVTNTLVIALGDSDWNVRWSACESLGRLGEKAATSEVINGLVISLGDCDENVGESAYEAIGRLGEKTAASEIINRLLISLGDRDSNVRKSAREALVRLGEKAATSEVISRLVISLRDSNTNVRWSACETLGRLGEKAATNEVINQLVTSLGDCDENVRESACKALGRLGEKTATNEVINQLVTSLGDCDENVQESACEALRRLGEKAATSEIINRLIMSVGDSDKNVRSSACRALGTLGEKAATSKAINELVIALGDCDTSVRLSACKALGRLGEKAATSEVINGFVISLGDGDMDVRESACKALGRLGEKAATSGVINRLIISLSESDKNVRGSACEALGRLGEKAATSEVINGLVTSLGDCDESVRSSACEALGRLGEKAATSEIINRLVISLSESDKNVRSSACRALEELGEKAATSEVINRLVISLEDCDKNVRSSACRVVGQLGEKAATTEIINGLVILLGESDENVRFSACGAVGQLGEKAATSEIIKRLVISLGDGDMDVRESACKALGRLGEKAATSEIINRLVISLSESDKNVRESACELLGGLGEKAATSEVINGLAISLRDSDKNVRRRAYEALGQLGEKAATSEIIGRLAVVLGDNRFWIRRAAVDGLNELVNILGRRNGSEASSVLDNSEHWINEDELVENSNICMKLFELLRKSEDSSLIPGCFAAALFGDCYVIMSENRIVVSGDKQPLKIKLSDSMRTEISKGFDNLWEQVTQVYRTGGALPGQKRKRSKSYLNYCHIL